MWSELVALGGVRLASDQGEGRHLGYGLQRADSARSISRGQARGVFTTGTIQQLINSKGTAGADCADLGVQAILG